MSCADGGVLWGLQYRPCSGLVQSCRARCNACGTVCQTALWLVRHYVEHRHRLTTPRQNHSQGRVGTPTNGYPYPNYWCNPAPSGVIPPPIAVGGNSWACEHAGTKLGQRSYVGSSHATYVAALLCETALRLARGAPSEGTNVFHTMWPRRS